MSHNISPVVWTIAGSDSCAGAGLQTDLHTFHDFGVVGNSVVTSVTAQHPHGVLCVTPVDTETYRQQFKALLVQGFPNAIKIGLLCNAEQVQILCETIRYIRANASQPLFVVYDPVAVASSGQSLSDSALLPIVKSELYPLVDLITPNGSELALLNQQSEESIDSEQAVLSCAKQLQAQGVKAVLAKGGHFAFQGEEVVDYLIESTGFSRYKHPRLHSINTHGTGCTFASAIAAMLAKGYDLKDSVTVATAYLQQGLSDEQTQGQTALSSLKHSGYPTDRRYFPITELGDIAFPALSHAFPATENRLGLYPVVDSLEWIERLLKVGVKTLQIRLKNRPLADVESDIQHAIALGKQYQARLFINDYWQLALKHGAYGVHLGQEDLATADLNALAQAGIRLGVSTHGYFEIMRVLPLKPSYIACGHIFPTQTKTMPSQPQGVANLARYVALLQGIPTVAIGGIKAHHFAQILATGVGSIAVVTAITQAEDWQQSVQALTALMQ